MLTEIMKREGCRTIEVVFYGSVYNKSTQNHGK